MMTQKPMHSKIAEKLKILHTRMKSILVQIHYLKKTLLNENGYLAKLCSSLSFEPVLKLINKKYPNIEIKTNKLILEPLIAQHVQILQELLFHYNSLVDVMEIKDNLMDLLGQIGAFQYTLDIRMNTQMTRLYLNLIADYASLMIMLAGIPQIRLILAIYNLAFNCKFDFDEQFYPRLCERLVEKHKDGCILELHRELNPYSRVLIGALASVSTLLQSKLASTNDWDEARIFQLAQSNCPSSALVPNYASLLPLSIIHRWLFMGYLVIYPEILRSTPISQTFRLVLDSACYVVLYRDDLLCIHPLLIKFCSSQKGLSKLVTMVKDSQKDIVARTTSLHRYRRNYLRLVMRHQLQVIVDQPGTIAPNLMILCRTISCATDEVCWLITQSEHLISKKGTLKSHADEWSDPQLPEFLFQIVEIRHLLQQFEIVPIYYKKMLFEKGLPALKGLMDTVLQQLTEDDESILTYFIDKINLLSVEEDSEKVPLSDEKIFKGVRLDWLRMQTYLSCHGSIFSWADNVQLVQLLNGMILHTKFIDSLPKFLDEFSSMKFLFFYPLKLNELFECNLKLAAQHRYLIIFPRICSHFLSNCRRSCPEDFNYVLRSSTDMAHKFLSQICQELCQLMTTVIKSQYELSLQSQPIKAIDLYHFHFQKRQKDSTDAFSTSKHSTNVTVDFNKLPGSESRRWNFDETSSHELELTTLSQLAVGLNSRPIVVNNRILNPAAYLKKEISRFLNDKFVSLANVKFKRDKRDPIIGARRTSEMKLILAECLGIISRISEHVNINVSVIFMEVFLSQSLIKDPMGRTTLTEIYCNWYVDFVLQQPHILHSPLLKCFLTVTPSSQKEASNIVIRCEEFTDIEELRALVEVIGPFGMRALNEKLTQLIVKNINALRRFVQRNRGTLIELNILNLDYTKIRTLLQNITDVDEFCQQWKQMGILFAFKDLCREAMHDIARKSMPFLKATVDDLQQDVDTEPIDHLSSVSDSESTTFSGFKNQLIVNELCQGFGLKTKMDSMLFSALESLKLQQQQIQVGQQENITQTEDLQNDLLMVATSYLLPRLVGSNFYHVEYEALDDNAHCAAYAIKELMYAFFSRYGEERMTQEIKKFIGLSSSNLLRLGLETNSHSQSNKEEANLINNRDSIYIFFDFVIQTLENVSDDFYEECFPYALVRQAYHNVVKQSRQVMTNAAHPTEAASKAALEASKVDVK